jgi:hypothetical protein
VLNIGIGLSFDHLLNLESSGAEAVCNVARTEKEEVNGDSLTPPFIQMNGLVADVEGQQQQTVRSKNSPKLVQRPHQVAARNVDDGIKGCDACPRCVGCV